MAKKSKRHPSDFDFCPKHGVFFASCGCRNKGKKKDTEEEMDLDLDEEANEE